LGEQRPVTAKRAEVEELQPGQERLEGSLGDAQFITNVEQIVLNLAFAEAIRGKHAVGGQLADGAEILSLSPFDEPGELQVLEHTVSEF
jgi:hypothetical protein